MRVYFVRHAQSRQNVDDPQNHPFLPEVAEYEEKDFSLTALGEWQADMCGQRLSQIELDAILCSPLHRTMSTAYGIVRHQKNNKQIELINDLLEKGINDYAGMPFDLMKRLYPGMDIIPCPDPTPTGGKFIYTLEEMYDSIELRFRARRVVDYIRKRFDNDATICLVSHGDFLGRYLIASLLDLPDEMIDNFTGFGCKNGSIGLINIDIKKNRTSCSFLNDTAHLDMKTGNIPLKK